MTANERSPDDSPLEDSTNDADRAARWEEIDRRKDRFLATLVHDLGNQIVPLQYAIHLLRLGRDEAIVEQVCQTMELQVAALKELLNRLRDISRLTYGQIDLRLQKVDAVAAARRALESVTASAAEAKVELVEELPSEPVFLSADVQRLEQMIAELLANAIRFSQPGGRVTLAADVADDSIELRVTDTGAGMTPDVLARAFDLMYRADDGSNYTTDHQGLGLTLVKKLAEQHGGGVAASSAGPGCGSEFRLWLPLADSP